MIDTIRCAFAPVDWTKNVLDSPWRERAKAEVCVICGDIEESGSRMFQHEESGLRVGGDRECASWCEVSVPRMLYGDNGIVLRPEDCGRVMERLTALVSMAAPEARISRLTRIDLVNQFKADVRDWIVMLRNIPHPKVRRKTKEWFDSGLTWPGSRIHINLYDKLLEKSGFQGDVARLEFQIRGRDVPEGLWSVESGFDFQSCYVAYRNLCAGFVPRALPAPTSMYEFLAWLESSGIVSKDGIRPLEVWLSTKSRASRYRIKSTVRRAVCPDRRIDFGQLLPADRFPEWIDCVEAEVEELVALA